MSLEYLLLPRLQVQAANAQAAWWLVNAAPVVAANLFAHNLGRQTGRTPEAGPFPVGVGIIHHHAQILGDRLPKSNRFHPQQRRGAVLIDKKDYPDPRAGEKQRPMLSLQPTVTCHLNWSLLLAYDEAPPSSNRLEAFLARARLAGGQIIGHAQPQSLESLAEVRKAVRSGHWLVERQDLLEGQGDPLDAMIRAVTQPGEAAPASAAAATPDQAPETISGQAESPPENHQPSNTWIVPATLGYAPLTGFTRREGARENYPHAYAEPLVGLVQYVRVHHYDRPNLPLWRLAWLDQDVFIVTQKEL